MKKHAILLVILFVVIGLMQWSMTAFNHDYYACSRGGSLTLDSLFEGANAEFSSAGKCDHCHGKDDAGIASVDLEGADVNLVDDWSSSIMANSAKDPYWRAKVSHELFVNPNLQDEIENTCTKCHAPLGKFAALMHGQEDYSIEEMAADPVALDGVSCLACHRQLPQPETALHTGNIAFHEDSLAFGPYFNPLITPMALYSGYTPEHSFHIKDSKLCAGCHSLVTPTVDLEGTPTGNEFVEQATWHEWLNSSYPTNEISCQNCHMPTLGEQGVKLAAGYDTPPRSPFALHTLVGGNVTMLNLMRDNHEELGIYPGAEQFNETINATKQNLQQQSLQMELTYQNRTLDSVDVALKLTNITGHKLPSGYPARRMTVVLYATNESGTETFRSGGFDETFHVVEEDTPFEPHHQWIKNEEQVQIYEMVMGDVNGQRTTVLLRGQSHLKDNRLVPLGFQETGALYDTTEVVLNITDTDFNHDPNVGSGTDIIHYRFPTNGDAATFTVHAEVYYQSIPPIWTDDLYALNTPEAQTFQEMFDATDRTPVLMKSSQINVPSYVGVANLKELNAFARWTENGQLMTRFAGPYRLELYDLNGKKLFTQDQLQGTTYHALALPTGTYLCVITSGRKQKVIKVLKS